MKTTIILAAVSLLAVAAFAAPVAITNPGFDLTAATVWATPACVAVPAPGCYSNGNVNGNTDWIAAGVGGQVWPAAGDLPVPTTGNIAAWLYGSPAGGSSTISQALTNAIPGYTYTLTLDIGNRNDLAGTHGGWPLANYYVALYEGANPIFNVANPVAPGDGTWANWSYSGVASGSGALKIELGVPAGSVLGQVWFDTVSLDGSVPEPATFALGGLGLLGIGILIRRRRA